MSQMIRILVAEDHPVTRASMAFLLNSKAGFEVVGEAEDGVMAVEMACTLRPDVVIMDIDMPKLNGVDATRSIVHRCPGVRIIGHSWHSSKEISDSMLAAGATAMVAKGTNLSLLTHTIREAGKSALPTDDF